MSSDGAGRFWRDRRWQARLGQATVATWIAAGLTMLSVVVAARALGPDSYGTVVLALSVTAVAARFLDFTFAEAVVHHGHRALAAEDISGLRALMRMSLFLDLTIGMAVAGALFLLAVPLSDIAASDGIDPALVRLAALGVLAVTVDGTTSAVLLIARRPDLRAWAQTAGTLFRVLGTVAAVAAGGGAEAILLSYALSGAAGSLLLGWIAWRVHFLGFVGDIRAFMGACDVLAFPTEPQLGEGFGLAALEAMATARPVIATRVGSLPEVVSDEATGLLVEPRSIEGLATALTRLTDDEGLRARLGERGRIRARDEFSLEGMVERTLSVYAELS